MELSPSEQLMYATLRIECSDNDGRISVGTGFNFFFKVKDGLFCPVILTNKHVVRNMVKAKVRFCLKDVFGKPLDKEHFELTIENLGNFVKNHPDDDVDLCAIPTGELDGYFKEKNISLFNIHLDETLIPNRQQLEELSPVEKILMVGYPNGLWDTENNKPIFRNGYTATHPFLDYCGKKEFLIDASCFPGSSGSPVILFEPVMHTPKNGTPILSPRVYLLGLLYAGPTFTATGEIQIIEVPTAYQSISTTPMMLNLGNVIRSERILELRPILGLL